VRPAPGSSQLPTDTGSVARHRAAGSRGLSPGGVRDRRCRR